jgi:hypothetical protein
MTNIFSSLNQYIRNSITPTYGDLLNNTSKEDMIKRTLIGEELTYYNTIKETDMKRLCISGGNNKNNDIVIENKIDKYVSGIGKVQQVM